MNECVCGGELVYWYTTVAGIDVMYCQNCGRMDYAGDTETGNIGEGEE